MANLFAVGSKRTATVLLATALSFAFPNHSTSSANDDIHLLQREAVTDAACTWSTWRAGFGAAR
jgi:hypothetical protein